MGVDKVAIIGPGAVGLSLAYELGVTETVDVILCSRRPIQRAEIQRPDGSVGVISAPVVTTPDVMDTEMAWVFLAVKAHQVPGAAPWLRRFDRPATTIVVLQNGVEHEASVAPFVESARVLPAVVWCSAENLTPTRVLVRRSVRLKVPAVDGSRSLAALVEPASTEVEIVMDFRSAAWEKLVFNAVAGLEALAGRRPDMFRLDDMHRLAESYAEECVSIGRSQGAEFEHGFSRRVADHFAARGADGGTSILYDRLAGRPLEWEARNGVIGRLGRHAGLPTPISDVVVPLLQAASADELRPDGGPLALAEPRA